MPTVNIETYDSDGNLVGTESVDRPESDQEAADREFRAAVDAATSVAELKAALLGTAGPGVEPRVRP